MEAERWVDGVVARIKDWDFKLHPIYRMVHIENLPSLLEWGCDWSPNALKAKALEKRAAVHFDIMAKREQTVVHVGPGGCVADYVAFYFGPLSPMLYAINGGKVEGCRKQREMIYLTTDAETVERAGLGFVFTDGHAIMRYVLQFDRLTELGKVPWSVIQAKYWNDFADGRCRRQSEFLVKDQFPLELVGEIGVMDEATRQRVENIIAPTAFRPLIRVRREWYF
jgi:hypothetical protein